MSKAVPSKKKTSGQSSTESSSGSTSDSSTSSSSTSGSDSSSSSDSDTTSSHSSKPQTDTEQAKKSTPVQKPIRKSTENKTGSKSTEKPVAKTKAITPKLQKQVSKPNIYSSEDEPTSKPVSKAPVKRKLVPKPKAITATGKNGNAIVANKVVPPKNITGKGGGSKVVPTKNIVRAANARAQNKAKEKIAVKNLKNADKSDLNKKKSIFSPENSSESENDSKNSVKVKPTPAKPRPKATAKAIEKPKVQEAKLKPESKQGPKSKAIISSGSSGTTTSESNSSSTDSDTSIESSLSRKGCTKKPVKKLTPKEVNSDSEPEIPNSKQITRKLTRSASTRKSKHVVGKNVYSDTDSDTESTKRSLSRSPVKRAPVATKGKTKNKKTDVKKSNEVIIEERVCPIESCSSLGHLGGRLDQHFMVDACPSYHNYTIAECKELLIERKKREDARKKQIEISKKSPRAQAIQDQKIYQQKIKDIRKLKIETSEDVKPHIDKNREPDLSNFVSDYDLKLFRDAQAIASEKIEEELKTQPNTKGTKYIEMGKFEMEVWYQSPYPEDYARLPKLYICEYCLRYMKSRTILQRHVHKCVWRHPPGEEVYRKDKISVWEVDEEENSKTSPDKGLERKADSKSGLKETGFGNGGSKNRIRKYRFKNRLRESGFKQMESKKLILERKIQKVDSRKEDSKVGLKKNWLKSKLRSGETQKLQSRKETQNDELKKRIEKKMASETVAQKIESEKIVSKVSLEKVNLKKCNQGKGTQKNGIKIRDSKKKLKSEGECKKRGLKSYLLTRVEGKIGSPEKPLSDLGLISYRSYWKDVLLNYLCKTAGTQLSVKDISQEMAIHSYDIVSTLQALGMMKYWKGKHIILRKKDVLDEYVERVKRRGALLKEVDPTCLRWTPFVPPQSNPS
ncbi:histone acetyltransferase [Holotrichia oblita]|uniref:Histone acetyltransferase n=1 Tax=Holotrichia oblita TaxID=644536 RepID=A0ACB9T1E9_HOLOL|nr:histone acetyltransferase [Holotrichia oblita]